MTKNNRESKAGARNETESDLPAGLSQPAKRAFVSAGYVRLEQFAKLNKDEILKLHGVGPKVLEPLRRALADKNLTFADEQND
ncbi:DNA-binding protein [Paenibacillus sp. MBLB4367]|uniref:DNA-binding protein n=1 Tax=Paenibacillus sp. MBLB4367 TaxID=3384767 RepID=UPI0039080B90